ncbi:MAG: hypothetical protein IIT36_03045 [Aeriscardovia sp.]|nr:hypothetical protein [Aeriscardovia sp.]
MTLEYGISAKTKRLTAKEWFVDLRFLGYEDTPIVDGVPEGGGKGRIGYYHTHCHWKKDANFGTPDEKYLFYLCTRAN